MTLLKPEIRTEAFDLVRPWLDRKGWTEDRIEGFDALFDRLGVPRLPIIVTGNRPPKVRAVSAAGIALIHEFEQCARALGDGRFAAYPDPGTGGAPWTIGWGTTGPEVRPGVIWTKKQCDDRFAKDIVRFAADVERAIGSTPTTQGQFDALVSFHYNTGAIGRATLTKRHKEGQFRLAAREFDRWNRAGGRVLRGLVRRRAAERAMYEEATP